MDLNRQTFKIVQEATREQPKTSKSKMESSRKGGLGAGYRALNQ